MGKVSVAPAERRAPRAASMRADRAGRPSSHTPPPTLNVGLDVHQDSILLAALPDDAPEPTHVERLATDERALGRLLDRLAAAGATLRVCYEASYAGYVVWHWVTAAGYHCDVVAPSLTPQRPGDHRKHDRRDATNLARWYRAGELRTIYVPTSEDERARDVLRCRSVFQRQLLRARHVVLNFLARRNLVYRRQQTHWKPDHLQWLRGLLTHGALTGDDALIFGEYLALMDYALQRRLELDRVIATLAARDAYRARVARLRCFRGLDTHAALTLITELGDWTRFAHPDRLAAYVGLVPTEHSSGPSERKGRITKAGNAHCRHILIQAAWHYRCIPVLAHALKVRQRGQPAPVIATSWKAQKRLYRRYHHLARTRGPQRAVVAIARELVGFLWTAVQDPVPAPTPPPAPPALAESGVRTVALRRRSVRP